VKFGLKVKNKMSEFLLELFSEEIPPDLQINARENLFKNLWDFFNNQGINFKKNERFSTPNRIIIYFNQLDKIIFKSSKEIRGPNVNSPDSSIDGFLRSNNINKLSLFKKLTDRGEFYFYKKPGEKIKTLDILENNLPILLSKIPWKKSMKWSDFNLSWGRPLKSIFCIFDGKKLNFKFGHLNSQNYVIVDTEFEEKTKKFSNFKSYVNFFNDKGIIIDQNLRKKKIEQQLKKIQIKNNFLTENEDKILKEVNNIVEQPYVIKCNFSDKYLTIPKEILLIAIRNQLKFFHCLNYKKEFSNTCLVVSNKKDIKGYIREGNERVLEARLNDAKFFWEKNKSQNLLKQIGKLKKINYFNNLGSYFDKVSRMRKLGSLISDEMLISKEKVEVSCSISKVDLMSDIVGEFPELQGILGGYFAESQGFDKEISLALKEQYLPTGLSSKIQKKPYSIALTLTDKIDTLVGFFGTNVKPTSSKDPFALRRTALGLIRVLVENKINIKLNDLIQYSIKIYDEQGIKLINQNTSKEINNFLLDRLKFFMKEKEIRADIVQAATNSFTLNDINLFYIKSKILNNYLSNQKGNDLISTFKRASNILENEIKNSNINLSNNIDVGLFKNEFEKNLFKKIQDIKKHFSSVINEENYLQTLDVLSEAKKTVYDFFDNVKVNDEDFNIKKNRLELIKMLCKTFNNFIEFSSIENKL
tara:strand:- start:153 stop:2252 length:2100 start_codon:yes stop_codon:yes gene_type:complete